MIGLKSKADPSSSLCTNASLSGIQDEGHKEANAIYRWSIDQVETVIITRQQLDYGTIRQDAGTIRVGQYARFPKPHVSPRSAVAFLAP